MNLKFKCMQCGECCSHIRGMISEQDKEFLKDFAYGKMPLVQLSPIEKISFPLWDWEAKRFMAWQEEVNIDAKIKPSRAILDLDTNKAVVVTYFMDSDKCPFLKRSETQSVSGAQKSKAFLGEKKCLIYDKKRAYICRLFPFNKGPFLDTKETEIEFGSCPAMKDILANMPDEFSEKIKYLNQALPYELLNIVQHDLIAEWVNKTIIELMKNRVIRPAMNYPYEFFLKRFKNAEKIDFTDFLAEKGVKTKKEVKEMINRFDNNLDAKEKIEKPIEKKANN